MVDCDRARAGAGGHASAAQNHTVVVVMSAIITTTKNIEGQYIDGRKILYASSSGGQWPRGRWASGGGGSCCYMPLPRASAQTCLCSLATGVPHALFLTTNERDTFAALRPAGW